MKKNVLLLIFFSALLIMSELSFAHCDTRDGPVVIAGLKAIKQNNINYALVWVKPEYEKELRRVFKSAMNVRKLGPQARELADDYFFETLVRLHRSGEGMAYTGIKPKGTPVDDKILAADKAILLGNLSPLNKLVPEEMHVESETRFKKVMSLKNYDVNNVAAGREYIEAYVQFFHFAEGEGAHKSSHTDEKH